MRIRSISTAIVVFLFICTSFNSVFGFEINSRNDMLTQRESTDFKRSDLQIGDFIFCEMKPFVTKFVPGIYNVPGESNDHVAMYIGHNLIIHSIFGGVRITSLGLLKIWYTDIVIGRVDNTTLQERIKVVRWAKTQLAKPYQYNSKWPSNPNPRDQDDKYSKRWTCAELVWAAYWNNGIDISNEFYDKTNSFKWITTSYLLASERLTTLTNIKPYAKIDTRLNFYEDPKIVDFSGWDSFDPDGKFEGIGRFGVVYRWDFQNNGTWTDWSEAVYYNFTYPTMGEHTVKLQVKDVDGAIDEATIVIYIAENNRPTKVENISGPKECKVGEKCTYTFNISDPNEDEVYYEIYFSDELGTHICGYFESGTQIKINHEWAFEAEHKIYVRVWDQYSNSGWVNTTVNVQGKLNNRFRLRDLL
jgi:uncharacterized protein YycO